MTPPAPSGSPPPPPVSGQPYSVERNGIAIATRGTEPVQSPGCVQARGALLVLRPADLTVLQASGNTGSVLGQPVETLLGRPVAAVLGADGERHLRAVLTEGPAERNPLFVLVTPARGDGPPLDVTAHTIDGVVVVEFEPVGPAAAPAPDYYALLKKSLPRLRATGTVRDFCDVAAREVRDLTGFDRVLVYQFHADGRGEVLAESRRADLPPWLGLHYPAEDVPWPARDTFQRTWVCPVADATGDLAELVPLVNPDTGRPLDMTHCALSGESVTYTEYLRTFGATAGLTLPVRRGGEVWGLIACHHYSGPRPVPYGLRAACEFLAREVSHRRNAAEDREHAAYKARIESAHQSLVARAAGGAGLAALTDAAPTLLDGIAAGGAALWHSGRWWRLGATPPDAALDALRDWLADRPEFAGAPDPVFATDSLGADYPPAAAFAGVACGVLAVPLARDGRGLILWFRPEPPRTVTRAGNPRETPAAPARAAPLLPPHRSDERFHESGRGRAAPWLPVERGAAAALRLRLIELDIGRAERAAARAGAVRDAEARYWTLFDAANDAILVADGEHFVDCNRRAERLFGRPREQILGRTPMDLSPPTQPGGEPSSVALARITAALDGRPQFFRWQHSAADGTPIDTEVSLSAIRVQNRWLLQGIVRDLSERVASERAVAQLAAFQEHNPNLIAEVGPDGRLGYVNPACARRYPDLAARDGRHPFVAAVGRIARTIPEGSGSQDVPEFAVDGRWYTGTAYRIPVGAVLRYYLTDVTPLHQARATLAESEARFRALIENAADIITVLDPAGVVLYESPSIRQYGYEPDELVGTALRDAVHPDDWAAVSRAIERAVRTPGAVERLELRYRHRNGSWLWLNASGRFVPGQFGPAGGIVVNSRDVTDRVEAEGKLRDALDLQTAILEAIPIPVFVRELSGRYLKVNPAFLESLGRPEPEVVGARMDDLFPPDVVAEWRPKDLEVMTTTGRQVYRGRFRTAAGEERKVWFHKAAVRRGGEVVGVVGGILDVTEQLRTAEALAESEARFRAFMDNSPIIEWLIDADGHVLFSNPQFEALVGPKPRSQNGKKIDELFPVGVVTTLDELRRKVVDTNAVAAGNVTLRAPDDVPRELWVVKFPVPRPAGPPLIGGLAMDLTDRRRAEERLQVLGAAIESSPNAVFIADRDGVIRWTNPSFTRLSGYTAEEAIGQTPRLLRSGHQDPAFYRGMWDAILAGRSWAGEVVERHKDGTEYIVRQTITPLAGPDGRAAQFVVVQEDVTARRRAEDRLRDLAVTDPLTGLLNRSGFRDRLAAVLTGEAIALHFLDLDRFKLVNDALGHAAGDDLLKQVADRLRRRVRGTDVVCRLGGDEFAVIQPGVRTSDDAVALAAGLIEALKRPFVVGGQEFRIGASVGVTLYPEDGSDPDTLLKNADLAMYRAKQDGRGAVRFFTPKMDAQVRSRLTLEGEIRRGLEAGEFELYYQPQVRAADGAVVAAEALVRWRHPTRGLVPPGDFLPVAEDSGLIVPLGDWVIRTACAEAHRWQDAGRPIRVAVNASVVQVQRGDLVASVGAALGASGLPAELLEVEITEGLLLPDVPLSGGVLRGLHALGVGLAVDDFGTGYSSLSYLRRLPVTRLKIDRSFVTGVPGEPKDAALVRAIIGLGHDLGLLVIAEGVETPEQLAFLRAEKCDEAQGYLVSRPVPAAEFARYLAAHPG